MWTPVPRRNGGVGENFINWFKIITSRFHHGASEVGRRRYMHTISFNKLPCFPTIVSWRPKLRRRPVDYRSDANSCVGFYISPAKAQLDLKTKESDSGFYSDPKNTTLNTDQNIKAAEFCSAAVKQVSIGFTPVASDHFEHGCGEEEGRSEGPRKYKYYRPGPPKGTLVVTNPRLEHIRRKYGQGRILQYWYAVNRYNDSMSNTSVAMGGPDVLKVVKKTDRSGHRVVQGRGPSGGGRLGTGRPSVNDFQDSICAAPVATGLETAIRCLSISLLPSVASIAFGPNHALLLTDTISGGLIYSAGSNTHGQLGLTSSVDPRCGIRPYFSKITSLEGEGPFQHLACGHNFSMCVASTGSVFTWGAGQGRALEDSQRAPAPTLNCHSSGGGGLDAPLPVRVRLPGPGVQPPSYLQPMSGTLPVHGASQVAAGYGHCLMLEAGAGAIWSWGQNVREKSCMFR